ncbi:MAG: transglutaminase domain-containing protein [Lewinella sp.]
MQLPYLTTFLGLLFATVLSAQTNLPVLYSTDTIVYVRDGDDSQPESWRLAPELRPDPFISSKLGERITFISDLDSISCTLEKDKPFDFVVVRGTDSAFTRITYEISKLEVLKTYAAYDTEEQMVIPAFTYAPADSPPLKALREKYNLDSIAGQGNDISQMLNLMRWVHNSVEHYGGKGNPETMDADALIIACGAGKGTLNCRGLAVVLNEVYLAMGIPSHFVTCLPRDPNDFDCHVINTAYSQHLGKWVWLDPTQNAYIMDEHGTLLSIPEVRQRLINDEPLLLNPDANWNYRGTTDKAWYLDYYMAKNLYRFSTPLHSTYGYETSATNKQRAYVELRPAGTATELSPKEVETWESGVQETRYRTHNPDLFWTKPVIGKK